MNTERRYSPEVRERAVRMVLEQQKEHKVVAALSFAAICHGRAGSMFRVTL